MVTRKQFLARGSFLVITVAAFAWFLLAFIYDWRGLINAVVANESVQVGYNREKICRKKTREFRLENPLEAGAFWQRIKLFGKNVVPPDQAYLFRTSRELLIFEIPVNDRGYILTMNVEDGLIVGGRAEVGEYDDRSRLSQNGVTGACFVPDRKLAEETAAVLESVGLVLGQGEKIKYSFQYGVSR